MSAWVDRHWNLAQAAGWVVHRDRRVVEELTEPSRDAFAAIGMFPTMHDYKARASVNDLRDALRDGLPVATGIRANGAGHREPIPAREWLTCISARHGPSYRAMGGGMSPGPRSRWTART